jgi:hypothetical protein
MSFDSHRVVSHVVATAFARSCRLTCTTVFSSTTTVEESPVPTGQNTAPSSGAACWWRGTLVVVLFIIRATRAKAPLLPLRLFRSVALSAEPSSRSH